MSRPSTWASAGTGRSNPAIIGKTMFKERNIEMLSFRTFTQYSFLFLTGINHISTEIKGLEVGSGSFLQTWRPSAGGFLLYYARSFLIIVRKYH